VKLTLILTFQILQTKRTSWELQTRGRRFIGAILDMALAGISPVSNRLHLLGLFAIFEIRQRRTVLSQSKIYWGYYYARLYLFVM